MPRTLRTVCLFLCASWLVAAERPRLAVLTDIGGDPDDQQSLIRLLVYANEFDLELLPARSDFDPRTTVSRWRPDFQRDFARRMAWCLPP